MISVLAFGATGVSACGGDDDGTGGSGAGTTGEGGAGGAGGAGGEGGGTAQIPEGCDVVLMAGKDDATAVQTALIEAKPGSTVCFSSGTFWLRVGWWLVCHEEDSERRCVCLVLEQK